MIKKFLIWAGIAFLIFFIAFRPNQSADVFYSLGNSVMALPRGIMEFFKILVEG